jgi:DNA-binding response OmpR family regulator
MVAAGDWAPAHADKARTSLPKILIVEDDALIAMELGERLADLGYEILGPAHSIAEAEALLARETPDGALLDASLAQGVSSVPLGLKLHAEGVRVAFCTGYDRVKDAPPELANVLVLTKPVSDADLKAGLEKLLS